MSFMVFVPFVVNPFWRIKVALAIDARGEGFETDDGFSADELGSAAAVLERVRDLFDELARERSAEADEPVEVGRPLARASHAEADSR